MSIEYFSSLFFEILCKLGAFVVGAGYPESLLKEQFGQPAHADAADADKMYMDRLLEIDLIHIWCSFRSYIHIVLKQRFSAHMIEYTILIKKTTENS